MAVNINNIEEIFALMNKFNELGMDKFFLHTPDGLELKFEKNAVPVVPYAAQIPAAPQIVPLNNATAAPKKPENSFPTVTAPLVGTFYASSAPGAEAFVSVGTKVKKGDILCIIEAMKVMNEIESEYSGTITEICAIPGKPVEYGQPLYIIKPDSAV